MRVTRRLGQGDIGGGWPWCEVRGGYEAWQGASGPRTCCGNACLMVRRLRISLARWAGVTERVSWAEYATAPRLHPAPRRSYDNGLDNGLEKERACSRHNVCLFTFRLPWPGPAGPGER